MRTSAKNTGYSEVLIFILELFSQVQLDCHEISSEEPRFVEIFKMIRGFCLEWTGSCKNRSKVTSSSTWITNFGKALIEMQNNCLESGSP